MNETVKYILPVLANNNIRVEDEMMIIRNSELFYLKVERLLIALCHLSSKQHAILASKFDRIKDNKSGVMNLLHDLGALMLSVKL